MRLDFDLQTLAFEHLGMSRNYDNTQIRRALNPAIEELETIGFIEKMPAENRYKKLGRGRWRVVFTKQASAKRVEAQRWSKARSLGTDPDRAEEIRDAEQEADRKRVQDVPRFPDAGGPGRPRARGLVRRRLVLEAELRVEEGRGRPAVRGVPAADHPPARAHFARQLIREPWSPGR